MPRDIEHFIHSPTVPNDASSFTRSFELPSKGVLRAVTVYLPVGQTLDDGCSLYILTAVKNRDRNATVVDIAKGRLRGNTGSIYWVGDVPLKHEDQFWFKAYLSDSNTIALRVAVSYTVDEVGTI